MKRKKPHDVQLLTTRRGDDLRYPTADTWFAFCLGCPWKTPTMTHRLQAIKYGQCHLDLHGATSTVRVH